MAANSRSTFRVNVFEPGIFFGVCREGLSALKRMCSRGKQPRPRPVPPGYDILIAQNNDPEEWVHHLLSLASPQARLRETLTAAALDLVRSRYNWETLGANLCIMA